MTGGSKILFLAAALVAQATPAEVVPLSTWVRHVGIAVRSDGGTYGCTTWASASGSELPPSEDRCGILESLPRDLLLRLRGAGSRDVSLELGEFHVIGDEEPAESEGRPLHIVYRRKVSYQVDAAGKITACKVIAESGTDWLGILRDHCMPGWKYPPVAADAHRMVTLETVITTQRTAPRPDQEPEGPTT